MNQRQTVTGKLAFYAIIALMLGLTMLFSACAEEEPIRLNIDPSVVEFLADDAYRIFPQRDTTHYVVDTLIDDHQLLLRDEEGSLIVLEVENPYETFYQTGLTITVIKL
jgi:hypothetical protein